MGGARTGAGRHKRDCDCEKCIKKHGVRPVDGNLARKIKAKIKAEEKWVLVITLATAKAERTENTADLRNALEYLDNRDLGTCVDTVNHLHDKPIEMNVKLSYIDVIERARKRATEKK